MTNDSLKHLAAFLPDLEQPEFSAGEMRGGNEMEPGILRMPYASYSEVVDRFIDYAYKYGWVIQDFDWPAWAQSAEAIRLRDEESALECATAEQLIRLLTVLIRQERFSEGSLLTAFESGLMLRIVRRAAALADDRSPRPGE